MSVEDLISLGINAAVDSKAATNVLAFLAFLLVVLVVRLSHRLPITVSVACLLVASAILTAPSVSPASLLDILSAGISNLFGTSPKAPPAPALPPPPAWMRWVGSLLSAEHAVFVQRKLLVLASYINVGAEPTILVTPPPPTCGPACLFAEWQWRCFGVAAAMVFTHLVHVATAAGLRSQQVQFANSLAARLSSLEGEVAANSARTIDQRTSIERNTVNISKLIASYSGISESLEGLSQVVAALQGQHDSTDAIDTNAAATAELSLGVAMRDKSIHSRADHLESCLADLKREFAGKVAGVAERLDAAVKELLAGLNDLQSKRAPAARASTPSFRGEGLPPPSPLALTPTAGQIVVRLPGSEAPPLIPSSAAPSTGPDQPLASPSPEREASGEPAGKQPLVASLPPSPPPPMPTSPAASSAQAAEPSSSSEEKAPEDATARPAPSPPSTSAPATPTPVTPAPPAASGQERKPILKYGNTNARPGVSNPNPVVPPPVGPRSAYVGGQAPYYPPPRDPSSFRGGQGGGSNRRSGGGGGGGLNDSRYSH